MIIMLIPDISCFENSVDHDQLASKKPADQDHTVFHSAGLLPCLVSYLSV